jgi:putative transposase
MTEQIIRILQEAETNGQSHAAICREQNICSQTFYRWKSKYGGIGLPEEQRLRKLERENTDLKELLADQMLKNKALEIDVEKTP